MKSREIKFALVGCGYWGANFLRIISNSEEATLCVICDTDGAKTTALAVRHPHVRFVDDVAAVASDPDIEAVVICTPVNTHLALTEMLIRAGKHVLCEKPLAQTSAQCGYLYTLAQEHKVVLLTGHVFEYNPVIRYMKQMIDDDALGAIRYLQLMRMGLGPMRSDVSVVFDLAAHDVAICISMMGHMPLSVMASGSCFVKEGIEDVAFMQLEFPGKVIAGIGVSWLDPIKQRLVKVVGEKKMMIFDDISVSEKLKIIDTGKNYQSTPGDFGSFQVSVKDGQIVIPNLQYTESLVTEFHHFSSCIRGREVPITDAAYAARVVRVLEAAQESIRQDGKKIYL
ncbi:MAG: Gfo/Idh/MocA family oxidoreductase [Bacteroidetes bacterium]|nr:Gfo/Idh/MocA family oxidoreductase [Bacteroidota bacterium]